MNKVEERRNTLQQRIEELEILRPRIEAMGSCPAHYAYSKTRATLKIAGMICAVIAIAIPFMCSLVLSEVLGDVLRTIFFVAEVSCIGVGIAAYCATEVGKYTYLVANKKSLSNLDHILTTYKQQVEDFERRKHDAGVYRPKFDRLQPVITQELGGTYKPHWWIERHFMVKIGFSGYRAEYYNLNEKDYGKLVYRIIAKRHELGSDELFVNFIQSFEHSLDA